MISLDFEPLESRGWSFILVPGGYSSQPQKRSSVGAWHWVNCLSWAVSKPGVWRSHWGGDQGFVPSEALTQLTIKPKDLLGPGRSMVWRGHLHSRLMPVVVVHHSVVSDSLWPHLYPTQEPFLSRHHLHCYHDRWSCLNYGKNLLSGLGNTTIATL